MGAQKNKDMSTFDILWSNLLDSTSMDLFRPITKELPYPIDTFIDETGLHLEVAAVGTSKEDFEIKIENNVLNLKKTSQNKPKENRRYLKRGIIRRDFAFALKITDQFDLSKLSARLENGLLLVDVPYVKEQKVLTFDVKID
jgi:HSP20 family molecular chaperone IbpA